MISTDKYPAVALEEAEALVDLLGLHDAMQAWAEGIQEPLELMHKNRYIFGLMDALTGLLENQMHQGMTLTPYEYGQALTFYGRVKECEREEVVL